MFKIFGLDYKTRKNKLRYDYDILCIGLGPAGMAVSVMGSEMGLKVCAIERHKIGGECMNCGCIPSKALLRMAEFRHQVTQFPTKRLAEMPLPEPGNVFEKIADDLTYINDKKTVTMFDKVDLILGKGGASFVDPHTVQVGDRKITAKRIFIAAGTRPAVLAIEGIDKVDYLTNENVFKLDRVPKSMIVAGGGAIACELAQAFSRLGTRVTIIQRSAHVLSRGDRAAAELVQDALREEGVDLKTGTTIRSVSQADDGHVTATTCEGETFEAEKLLMAASRCWDYDSLNLDAAGIKYDEHGIKVNRKLQTSRKSVYAVGDCNGHHLFSHAAMHQGMIALMNCMIPGPFRLKFDKYVVPSTIFTDPQISQVGMTEKQLVDASIKYETHQVNYGDYGAAIAEDIPTGFVKAFTSPLGRIYGVVIVGHGSGEMINEWAMAIQYRLRIHKIMMLQHSFPTMGFLTKRVSETWMMSKMRSRWLKRLCRWMF